jgi:hypothetical protein
MELCAPLPTLSESALLTGVGTSELLGNRARLHK